MDTMTIGVNGKFEIKAVNNTDNENLTFYTFENEEGKNPFFNWDEFLILCYCYKKLENGYTIYPQFNYSYLSSYKNIVAMINNVQSSQLTMYEDTYVNQEYQNVLLEMLSM